MIDLDNIDFIESQGIFIWGDVGTGKTMLLCKFFQDCMMRSLSYVHFAYDEVDFMNRVGYKLSKNFEHLAFGNFGVNTEGLYIPDLRSYEFNPYRLGIAGSGYKTLLTVPYSTHFYTEFQNYAPSEMNENLRPDFVRVFQIHRHLKLGFVVDAQRPTDVAKKVRSMFSIFIECTRKVDHVYKNGVCVGHVFHLRVIRGHRLLDEYLRTNNVSLCEEFDYRVNRCLFEGYDTLFCSNLHYKGRENQNFYIKHFEGNEDILTTPPGHFIKKTDRAGKFDDDSEVLF